MRAAEKNPNTHTRRCCISIQIITTHLFMYPYILHVDCGLKKKDSFKYPNRYFVNVLIVPTITVDKKTDLTKRERYMKMIN